MKKNCKLIATLPSLHDKKLIDEVMSNPLINEVRFNSGVNELLNANEIVTRLKVISDMYKKKVWIDLKARQLRIVSWGDTSYEAIELNHDIDLQYPAKAVFRGSNTSDIIYNNKNKIVLSLPPERAVGKGQSVNIIAKNLDIKGYLTSNDIELIQESKILGLNDYMASFVEKESDITQILNLNKDANIVSKIESEKGMKFIKNTDMSCYLHLMAARDDLYNETGMNIEMLKYLRNIICIDNDAICASKIFSSLDYGKNISLSDYEDLELMYLYGYRNFMLGDNIKGPSLKLKKALNAWEEFINE